MARVRNAAREPAVSVDRQLGASAPEAATTSSRENDESLGRKSRRILAAERRSLHVDDRIPVVVVGRDTEAEGVQDFGEFQRWVLRLEEEATANASQGDSTAVGQSFGEAEDLCVIGQDGKPLKICKKQELSALIQQQRHPSVELVSPRAVSASGRNGAGAALDAARQRPQPEIRGPIAVPQVREVALYAHVPGARLGPHWGKQVELPASAEHAPSLSERRRPGQAQLSISVSASSGWESLAYIRHKQPSREELDAAVEYDMDEQDEAWLEEQRKRLADGKLRLRSASSHHELSEDDFELLMDRLEKEYCRELLALGKEALQAAAKGSLAPAKALPLAAAVPRLPEHLQEPWGRLVHGYWLSKPRPIRAGPTGAEYPLLPRLRSHLAPLLPRWPIGNGPWKAWVPELPFMGRDKQRGPQRTLDASESFANMRRQRKDIEVVRILTDQVRRRERLKRNVTRTWIDELRARAAEAAAKRRQAPVAPGEKKNRKRKASETGAVADKPAKPLPPAKEENPPSISTFKWVEYDRYDTAVLPPSPPPREAESSSPGESKDDPDPEVVSTISEQGPAANLPYPLRSGARAPKQPQSNNALGSELKQPQRPKTPSGGDLQRASKRQLSSETEDEAASRPPKPPLPSARRALASSAASKADRPPNLTELCRCKWCKRDKPCVVCRSCRSGFCYMCVRSRPGMGVHGWAAAIHNDGFRCESCVGASSRDALPAASTSTFRFKQHQRAAAGAV